MDDDLIQKPTLETLPRDVGAQHDDVTTLCSRLREPHCLLDTEVNELAGDAFDDGRLGGRIVPQHEERAAKGAAVETRL